MKALMLAAGVGRRLYGDDDSTSPHKALLEFGGRSLLRRHIEILQSLGVAELVLVLGHLRDEVLAEANKFSAPGVVSPLHNPRYREGPMISLWTAREVLRSGSDILFMDADVLHHPEILRRLLGSPHANCFIYDRDFEAGDEPVNLCLNGGRPVDFGKKIPGTFETRGEWPGFLRLSGPVAAKLADATQAYINRAQFEIAYEPAMRDVLLAEPAGTFGAEDITGLPWIEIDFPSDVIRAGHRILPHVETPVEELQAIQGIRASAGR
ncbi:MAG: phosphocholine cytidylyltransferase family protein [Rhodospirillales bacterium]|nr:phosphocholine cytidylyltransferase family protein [Rhodospirillales bacterium]